MGSEDFQKKFESLLDALTEQSLESTATELAKAKKSMEEAEFFAIVSNCIVNSAVAPDAPSKLYVQFVLEMQSRVDEKTMKRAVLTAVQQEYNSIWERDVVKYIGCDDEESQDQPMILDKHKAQWLGFMEFLGLLYVNGLVPEVVLRSVLDRFAELRGSPDENVVEGICQLLLTDGVVYKLFSSTRGEGFITQWKGLKQFQDFTKKKTKYLDLKSVFEDIRLLVENKGKAPRNKPVTKSGLKDGFELGGKTKKDDTGAGRFAALGEESPSGDRGKGKGYSKAGRGEKGGEKGDSNQPDPRQVFVAGIGSSAEDEIKAFFQQVGDADRVKVLRTPEGDSRDVCFITFRTEDQAQKALSLHGSSFAGRNLTVRIANGKKGGEKGTGGKGAPGSPVHSPLDRSPQGGKGGPGSPVHSPLDRSPPEGGPPDLGGSSRFDALGSSSEKTGEDLGGLPPPRSNKGGAGGKSGGRGGGKGKTEWMAELDVVLEEELAAQDGPLRITDFDFTAKRFLSELRQRDRLDGTNKFKKALDWVFEYTTGKDRSAVKKWTAYTFTLLQKFDPEFAEDFKRRDEERRRQQLPLRGNDDE